MKLKYIIGILALLLLMVGTASATDVHLTVPNEPEYNDLGIDVLIHYEGSSITVTDKSPDALNVNLKEIGIVLPDESYRVTAPAGWTVSYNFAKGFEESKFGLFTCQVKKSGNTVGDSLELTLNKDLPTSMDPNDNGNVFVVHVNWGAVPDLTVGGSGWFGIPEFPTMALPVAAILGLMFVFGRRKQE